MTYSCAIFPSLDIDLHAYQSDAFPTRTSSKKHVSGTPSKVFKHLTSVLDSNDFPSPESLRDIAFTSVESESTEHRGVPSGSPTRGSDLLTLDTTPIASPPESSNKDLTNGNYTPTLVASPGSPVDDQKSDSGQIDGSPCPEMDELYLAQIRKLDHIIRKADIRPGHRVGGAMTTIPFSAIFHNFFG